MGDHPSERRIQAFLEEHKPEYVLGIDEVAYGSAAGGLYVAAYMSKTKANLDVKDSKQYGSRRKLDETALRLKSVDNTKYVIYRVNVPTLNRLGLGTALKEAFNIVVDLACQNVPEGLVIVVDGIRPLKAPVPVLAVPKADVFVRQVSAASVVAKHSQLIEMDNLDEQYPPYGFGSHHGYLTLGHIQKIKQYGITPEHRTYVSFIKKMMINE
jgi:ribonuclease HII